MSFNQDLNIENYDLEDILNLFFIQKNFTEQDLQKAKKMVLMTHPDKSRLPPDYFRFYTKAYKKLYFIWQFKSKDPIEYQSYEEILPSVVEDDKKVILKDYLRKNKINKGDNFNTWFNEQFEKGRVLNEEQERGYGDWLRSNEDVDEEVKISHAQMGEEIEKRKQHVRSLVVHRGINESSSNSNFEGCDLTGNAPDYYSSGLFSNLQYEDLRKAHVESVIPVTVEDYNNVPKFNNLESYLSHRSGQDMAPLSEQQAHEYLNNKSRHEEIQSTERAFKLAQQLETSNRGQTDFWGAVLQLKN
jgi:hypothetical protein